MGAAEQIIALIHRATSSLRHRLDMVASRIVVEGVKDGSKLQSLKAQALADEPLEDIEHMQPGGLSHVPLSGAEGVLICVAGRRDIPIALCVSNRAARPTGGAPGETVLYCASQAGAGVKIRLKANGDIELTPTAKVTIAGKVEITGDVAITGALTVTGEVTAKSASMPIKLSTHPHNTAMGPSGPPNP